MSIVDPGGRPHTPTADDLQRRDYAKAVDVPAQIMAAIIELCHEPEAVFAQIALWKFDYADAMLAEQKRRESSETP